MRLGWKSSAYAPSPPARKHVKAATPHALSPMQSQASNPATTPQVSRLKRFSVAIAGALSLLIPTFIMVLVEGRAVDLITASVAILLVAIAMGLSPFELRTVLSITSGYAAIMIVFVGTRKIPYDEIAKSGRQGGA